MASAGDRYLPDLVRCFSGDAITFSWAEMFKTLNEDTQPNTNLVNTFISSPKVRNLLSLKVPIFPPPSQQAKSTFDTKTAAVSITPSPGSAYDIEVIKNDAKWLSDEVRVAEDEALRVTVLEWQYQPAARLLAGYSDAEFASLNDALGSVGNVVRQGLDQLLPKRNDSDFDSKPKRRKRLLALFFREQRGLLNVARRLQELALIKHTSISTSDNLTQFAQEMDHTKSTDIGVGAIIESIDSRLQNLESGRTWSTEIEDAHDQWIASELQCILSLEESLLLRIRGSSQIVASDAVLQWLQIMTGCDFFATVECGPLFQSSQIESLQSMTALVTVAMLDPATAMHTLGDFSASVSPSAYYLDGDVAHDLHRILLSAAEAGLPQACPSAFAWAMILVEIKRQASMSKENRESGAVQRAIDQAETYNMTSGRRTSSGSFQPSIFEEVMNSILNTSDISEPATYLLRCTVEVAHIFDTISVLAKEQQYRSPMLRVLGLQVLQELMTVAVSTLGYTSEILSAQFAILEPSLHSVAGIQDAVETFIKNDFLITGVFDVAAGRFPYESLPYLRLCRLLASANIFDDHGAQYISFRLHSMDSYTQPAVGPFANYRTVREDENLNLVALDGAANMHDKNQRRLLTQSHIDFASSVIPADTLGEVISESQPPVIRWQHSYSGLAMLGGWLQLYHLGQLQAILSPYEHADDIATEIISLFTQLLQSTCAELPGNLDVSDRERLQDDLLEEASSILQGDSTVIDFIFEILEQTLQAYRRRPSNSFNTSTLVACVGFATIFCQIRPNEFWPALSRTSLLESYGSDSFLLSIVSGVEVPNQYYPFLEASTKLYNAVCQAALQQFSQPSISTTKPSRIRKYQLPNQRLRSTVLSMMTQALYTAFEFIPAWSFANSVQRDQLVSSLATSFGKVIQHSNVIEHSKAGLTAIFHPASDALVQRIRSGSDDLSESSSITRHLFQIEYTSIIAEADTYANGPGDVLRSLHSLSTILLKLEKLHPQSESTLNKHLFSSIPLHCRALARSTDAIVIELLNTLVEDIAKTGTTSLLGNLGSTSALCFLEILRLNLGDWTKKPLQASIWKLLSALVGRNQQWLAIVVLTGAPPERALKQDTESASKGIRGKTFMETALRRLIKIAEMDPIVTTSMLKFVIRAQMNWSWANEAMKSNKDFLPAIMSYVCNTFIDASDDLKISLRNKIASLVTDLSTIYLHHAKAKRDTTTLKTILPLLRWIAEHAIDVKGYNYSLHMNLRKNFASKFEGLELNDFKRTEVVNTQYGSQYFYDLDFADQILGSEQQWLRNDRYRDQSFSAELRRANLNLSVVDSEVKLLNSCFNLCIEHSGYFAQDSEFCPTIVDIVKNALRANTQVYPAEKVFDSVLQIRADMSISLLQRLVDVKAKGPEPRALLRHAWECARLNNGSLEQAILDGTLPYWRSMLTIIMLTLQFHIDKQYMPPAADSSPAALLHHTEQSIPTILEITSVVVGQGMRSAALSLQDQRQSRTSLEQASSSQVTHKDIHLILTVLETILRMTRLPEFISEVSQRLIVEGTIQSCFLLYSWSHILTGPELDNEPVYAGHCLQILTCLSSLPLVTEELAVEGVLGRLLSARITQKLQSVLDGAGHLDKRPHVQTMYNFWATGILPLCLNLLHSVGGPVAAEVSIFLNQFPQQLNRASVAFIPSQARSGNLDFITSTVANEATTLALVSHILGSFRTAGASAAVDPTTIQVLAGYDEHKKALSEDISDVVNLNSASLKNRVIPVNERELGLSRDGNGEALVKKVVMELRSTLMCLKGGDVDEDK